MISINQKKYVNSLKQKKFRTENNSFVVEGIKMLEELLLSGYEVEFIFATQNWILICLKLFRIITFVCVTNVC